MLFDLDTPWYEPEDTVTAFRIAGIGRAGRRIAQELAKTLPDDVGFDFPPEGAPSADVGAAHLLILVVDPEDENVDLAEIVARTREAGSVGIVAVIPMPPETDSERTWLARKLLRSWRPLLDGLCLIPPMAAETADADIVAALSCLPALLMPDSIFCMDLADIGSVLENPGWGRYASREASGEHRAERAVKAVMALPRMRIGLERLRKALVVITTGSEMSSTDEYYGYMNAVTQHAPDDLDFVFGVIVDPSLDDRLRVGIFVPDFYDMD